MKHLLLLGLTLFTGHYSAHCQGKPSFSVTLDSTKGAQLLKQCSRGIPGNVKSFWTPASNDIQNLESNLDNLKKVVARDCCIIGAKIDSLQSFAFQYLGVVIKGKKYIYINAFPPKTVEHYKERKLDLATTPVVVCDGGDHYWGVLFDPETKQFSSLAFNGVA